MSKLGIYLILFKIFTKIGPSFIKLFKSIKVAKVGLAGASMAAYSYIFTWEFALILLLAIVIHEYGHLNAMKNIGIKTKGIYLIPFFGGAAVASESFKNYKNESYVAIMGPLYGLFTLIPFIVAYYLTNNVLFIGLVSFIALLNLFNLLPINPLDGGRIIKSIAFSMNTNFGIIIIFLGMILATFIVWKFEIYLLLFILIIGLIEFVIEFFEYKKNKVWKEEYEKMSTSEILKYSIYFSLLATVFLFVIYYTSSIEGADIALKILKDQGIE